MPKRKSSGPILPQVIDNLPKIPTLPEIKRLDQILGAIIDPLIGCNPHHGRTKINSQIEKSGMRHAPARNKGRKPADGR